MVVKECVNRAQETTCRGAAVRTPPVPRDLRDRGPEGRHGRLPGKAPAAVPRPLKALLARLPCPSGLSFFPGGLSLPADLPYRPAHMRVGPLRQESDPVPSGRGLLVFRATVLKPIDRKEEPPMANTAQSKKARPPVRGALCRQQGPPFAHPHLPAQGRRSHRLGQWRSRRSRAEGRPAGTGPWRDQGRAAQEHRRAQDVAPVLARESRRDRQGLTGPNPDSSAKGAPQRVRPSSFSAATPRNRPAVADLPEPGIRFGESVSSALFGCRPCARGLLA
jgi:hypothetical protein